MKTIEEATKAIITKFKNKDVELDEKEVETKLKTMVKEFGMLVREAERTVQNNYAREHNVKLFDDTDTKSMLANIQVSGTWANLEVVCLKSDKPFTSKIYASGVLADESGEMPFTAWSRKNDGKNEPFPKFIEGHLYKISNAVANSYNDVLAINMNASTHVVDLGKSKVKVENKITNICDITSGINNIECKVVKLFEQDAKNSDKIYASGYVGDETGTIKFTIWKSTAPEIEIVEGKCYRMDFTKTSVYNDKLSIIANSSVCEIDKEIEVKSNEIEIIGIFANVADNSGVIRRCPVEGCGRVLDRRNYCDVHERQLEAVYDLRIKGTIDTGVDTYYANVNAENVTKLTGYTLDEAITIVKEDILGNERIYGDIVNKIVGRYYKFKCVDFGNNVMVLEADPIEYKEFVDHIGEIKISEQTTLDEAGGD